MNTKSVRLLYLILVLVLSGCVQSDQTTPTLTEQPVQITDTPVPTQIAKDDTATPVYTNTTDEEQIAPKSTKSPPTEPPPDHPIVRLAGKHVDVTVDIWGKAEDGYLALQFTNIGEIVIVSQSGALVQKITIQDYSPLDIEWSTEGSEIFIVATDGMKIIHFGVNLKELVVNEYFIGGRNEREEWPTFPRISPDKKFLTYVVWSGEFYYDSAQFHDVEIIALTEPQLEPIQVTNHGGAWRQGAVWSPTSDYLAFSDLDASGIAQIYTFDLNTQAISQRTNFTTAEHLLLQIGWSSNGKRLAFVKKIGEVDEIWAVDIVGNHYDQILLPEPPDVITGFWWDDDGRRLLISTFPWNSQSYELVWYDVGSKKITQVLPMSNSPIGNLYLAFPITSIDEIGVLFLSDVYKFDAQSEQFDFWFPFDTVQTNPNTDLTSVAVRP